MGNTSQHDLYMTGGGGGAARQPNFLQKLYAFLSLHPHPCPDIIYWASDSRQLVIAQPDRLVKEVLPKLFKHDKLASFGRQLNIYGFSRLFPGRQFKDASGNVSNASVWAHPTLHRLSTPDELNTIKRRAPPKLVRTRRLASGEVVRTKAGPAVLEKAREVREVMREGRRRRVQAWAGAIDDGDSGEEGGSPMSCYQDQSQNGDEDYSSQLQSPQASTPMQLNSPFPPLHLPQMQQVRNQQMMHHRLSDIAEFPEGESARAAPQNQPGSVGEGWNSSPDFQFRPEPPALPQEQATKMMVSPPLTPARPYQSCPASIHTSPTILPQTPADWKRFLSSGNMSAFRPNGLKIDTAFANLSTKAEPVGAYSHNPRIAAPAALPPFSVANTTAPSSVFAQSPNSLLLSTPLTSPRGYFSSASNTVPSSYASTPLPAPEGLESSGGWAFPPSNTVPPQANVNTQQGQVSGAGNSMNGTIDPRWISPVGSVWSTPSVTRAPSPVHPVTQSVHMTSPLQQQSSLQSHEQCLPEPDLFEQPEESLQQMETKLVPPPFLFGGNTQQRQPLASPMGDVSFANGQMNSEQGYVNHHATRKAKTPSQSTQTSASLNSMFAPGDNTNVFGFKPLMSGQTFPPERRAVPMFSPPLVLTSPNQPNNNGGFPFPSSNQQMNIANSMSNNGLFTITGSPNSNNRDGGLIHALSPNMTTPIPLNLNPTHDQKPSLGFLPPSSSWFHRVLMDGATQL